MRNIHSLCFYYTPNQRPISQIRCATTVPRPRYNPLCTCKANKLQRAALLNRAFLSKPIIPSNAFLYLSLRTAHYVYVYIYISISWRAYNVYIYDDCCSADLRLSLSHFTRNPCNYAWRTTSRKAIRWNYTSQAAFCIDRSIADRAQSSFLRSLQTLSLSMGIID